MAKTTKPRKPRAKKTEFALPTIPTKADNIGSLSLIEPILASSGSVITEETALRISTAYACVNVITNAIAQLARHIYQRLDNGRMIARELPLYSLVHDAPNDYMTGYDLFLCIVFHRAFYGNAYVYVDRDEFSGEVKSLQPLLPDRTEPVLENGKLFYRSKIGGLTQTFSPADILHFKGLSYDGITGYPVVRLIRSDLGQEQAAGEFAGKLFASGSNMGGVINIKGKISPEARDRLRNDIKTEYQGNSNAFKIMLLEEGWAFTQFGTNAEDSQMNETRMLLIRKIAAAFAVPPHKVGDNTRTGYASLEEENRAFYQECINPILRCIEDEFNRKLFTEQEKKDGFYFEFNRMSFLQAKVSEQTQHFHLMLQDGVYLRNEVREFYGLNPIEGGDVPMSPLNMREGTTANTGEDNNNE